MTDTLMALWQNFGAVIVAVFAISWITLVIIGLHLTSDQPPLLVQRDDLPVPEMFRARHYIRANDWEFIPWTGHNDRPEDKFVDDDFYQKMLNMEAAANYQRFWAALTEQETQEIEIVPEDNWPTDYDLGGGDARCKSPNYNRRQCRRSCYLEQSSTSPRFRTDTCKYCRALSHTTMTARPDCMSRYRIRRDALP